ncbi:quinoprotein relay system zinc metallohydrolase 2 [Methylocapsa acidiphila]|uniref:quinoprotein relay system zinc metallohydrolase 2 n=1 Tax=Methylocapsa acidiphila TaxID=133552 RepID=UPI000411670A|nr:quinoprotein relay system zinc metallohydrolase 2 [Methylocapsa acidiphila]
MTTGALATTRRRFLAGGLCLCCLPAARRAIASPGPFPTDEIAEGVHIRRGFDEDATTENEDAIANVGFIIGRDAVLVADPGGSLADGENLRATIKQKTDLPIKYVVMSHVHPDHIFGAGAFRRDEPIFVGHARLAEQLAQRGDYYAKGLAELLGAKRVGAPVAPTMEVREKAEINLGGRVIVASAHPAAHTMSDLSLLDKKTGVLLTADLVFVGRIPSLDGSLQGWLDELAKLKAIGAARIAPGHGPTAVEWPIGAAGLEQYLKVLERETQQAIASGKDIETAITTVAQSERGKWKLFDDYNGRNVAEAYKELEWR